ncbi:MAG: hypothetical protein HRT88_04600 [Lentisphaeraceae bacterium]|nr:hypothetical protein [Lentisphaeraceae bacterium]
MTYNGTTQSDRPRLSDFKGKPLKEFILRWGSQKAHFPLHLALSKANQAKFLVSAGSRFEGRVHEMRVKDPLHNTIKNISYTLKKGSLRSTNGFAPISDNDPDTTTRITTDDEGKFVLEFSCAKTSISKFYCMIIGSGSKNYTLEYFDKGSWTEFAWGNVSRLQGFRYNSPCPASTRFRMSIQTEKPLKFDIVELHFFK